MKRSARSPKTIVKNISLTVLGTLLLSMATGLFILPYNLVVGGVSGFAILMNNMLPWGEEIWIAVVTVAVYILGIVFLNKDFALKTLISTIVYPAGVALFSYLASPDVLNGVLYLPGSEYSEIGILLSALFGGILSGIGCAITFLGGGSTGGVDIIAFIICRFFKKAKSSYILFIIDAAIITAGIFINHSFVVTLLGIVCAFMTAVVIDKVFLGQSRAFIANIVSASYKKINQEIIEKLDRSTTVIPVTGGYTGREQKMLMVSFTMNQYATLINIINRNDRDAFVTIHPAHEINGEGFTRDKK